MLRRIASYLKGYERFAAASPLLVVLETGCELTIPQHKIGRAHV